MFDKLKDYIPQIIEKVKAGLENTPTPVKWIALLYFLLVSIVLLMYLVLFCYEYSTGETKSKDLLPFLNIIIGGAFIGFVTFIVGLCIDANNNGIADSLEKRLK